MLTRIIAHQELGAKSADGTTDLHILSLSASKQPISDCEAFTWSLVYIFIVHGFATQAPNMNYFKFKSGSFHGRSFDFAW